MWGPGRQAGGRAKRVNCVDLADDEKVHYTDQDVLGERWHPPTTRESRLASRVRRVASHPVQYISS